MWPLVFQRRLKIHVEHVFIALVRLDGNAETFCD